MFSFWPLAAVVLQYKKLADAADTGIKPGDKREGGKKRVIEKMKRGRERKKSSEYETGK